MKIYSVECGLEDVDDVNDLEGNATVVVAVLCDGVETPPRSVHDIERIYCPSCGWLNANDYHSAECPHEGAWLV